MGGGSWAGLGSLGGWGDLYLGGGGLQGVQLVHSETELVQVDVDIDQKVRGQSRREHPLEEAGGMRPSPILGYTVWRGGTPALSPGASPQDGAPEVPHNLHVLAARLEATDYKLR